MRTMRVMALAWVALGAAACASNNNSRPGADGGRPCLTAAMCDDGIACTSDTCAVGGVCEWTPLNMLCMAGETCVVGRGCTGARPCTMSSECSDMIDCTVDMCVVGGMCANMPVDGLCTAPMVCNVGTGCGTPMGCGSAAECDDSIPCTVDGCSAARMCTHTPIDASCMMGERCIVGTGCMAMMPCTTDEMCQDTSFCNGREVCDTKFGCQAAPMARNCADTDPCTVDSCDTTANMCVHACDASMPMCGCTAKPDCNGTFDLTPTATYSCVFGIVNIRLASIDLTCDDRAWNAVTHSINTMTGSVPLGQVPAPAGMMFDLVGLVPGDVMSGCSEEYHLTGTFTDADNFTGMFTATYTGGGCLDCGSYSTSVTGRRR